MIIGVAGPYSAATEEQRMINFNRMNEAAARLLEKGHIPLIGINAALPVLAKCSTTENYEAAMKISLAVIESCEALLLLAESPGANRERDLVASKGFPIYHALEDVPEANDKV